MARKTKQTLWLVGGGTGGHLVPLLAVAQHLRGISGLELTYIGERGNQKDSALARQASLPVLFIPVGKLRRNLSLRDSFLTVRDAFRLLRGIYASYRLIKTHRPALIFSKGGPVALPVGCAAWLTNTPLVTHESDAVMGATNRFLAHFARTVFTGFPASVYPARYARKIQHVGIPLRQEFCRSRAKLHRRSRPMVLITGGSQGAHAINVLVGAVLPQLLKYADVMHITGALDYSHFQTLKEGLPSPLADRYGAVDFTPDIAAYMREADLVVTRASSTIFEVASLGKPMFLIPLPSAAHNHQVKNAELFVAQHAAVMARQENLTPDSFYETIKTVLSDTRLQDRLREGTRYFACCQAAKQVAAFLMQTMQEIA